MNLIAEARPRALVVSFSRSGHTRRIARALVATAEERGFDVEHEVLQPLECPSRWRLAWPLLSSVPVLPLYLLSARFRIWWHQHYPQPEQALAPLRFPDLAEFDRICIGGPKWLYLSYPVARYLEQVGGLEGKVVHGFTSFCGPPLKRFELEMYFAPLAERLRRRGATLGGCLALSSHAHEFFLRGEMVWVFRGLSRILFGRSLRSFTLDSGWGRAQLAAFCDRWLSQRADKPQKNVSVTSDSSGSARVKEP